VRTKLAAYGAVLAAALAGGAVVGAAVGPIDGEDDPVEAEPVDVTNDPVHDVHPSVVLRGMGFDR
jgi:hypothetical protein